MQQESVDRAALARLAEDAGVELPKAAVEPLAVYLELLTRWNRVMNLVGPHAWRIFLPVWWWTARTWGRFCGGCAARGPADLGIWRGAGLPYGPCGWSGLTGVLYGGSARKSAPYFFQRPGAAGYVRHTRFFCGTVNTFQG